MVDLVLQINGRNYGGWDAVRVTRGIEQIAGSFDLSVTDRWTQQGGRSLINAPIAPGDRCRVSIGNEAVIDGYVDDRNVSYSRDTHTINITGRDRCGDLVDCSTTIKQTKGQTLLQIATAACAPFGIAVTADADVGKPFADEYAEPGQTVFDLLSTLAGHRGLLLISDGLGGLRITTEHNTAAPAALRFGDNIEACNGRASMRDRYRDYTALHQAAQTDLFSGEVATEQRATGTDNGVARYRPLTMMVDDGGDLQARVDYERNVRAGRARAISYTVSDWLADGRQLWRPNTVVTVTDPNQQPALNNTPMLISSVTYSRDSNGSRAELGLVLPGAFNKLAVLEQPADAALF